MSRVRHRLKTICDFFPGPQNKNYFKAPSAFAEETTVGSATAVGLGGRY